MAVRAILVLAWLLFAVNAATEARDASVAELAQDLTDGRVSAIQVMRAEPDDLVQGEFALRWDAGLVDSFTQYEYDRSAGVDEAAPLLAQARSDGVPVQVVSLSEYPIRGEVTPDGWFARTFGGWFGPLTLLTIAGSLIVLVTGPRPWFATRWAWFWLVWAVPILWLAFLALEPRPLRLSARWAAAGRPIPRLEEGGKNRLTGGWAFVLAWAASGVLAGMGLSMLSTWT